MYVYRSSLARLLVSVVIIGVLAAAQPAAAADKFKSFKLRTVDGTTRTLDDYKGKVTLVAFFFPTCTYCNQEFPQTVKIYDKYKDQGLNMVWINLVPEEEDKIPGWLAEHNYHVPVLVGASQQYLLNRYDVRMTPEHYLLNADGVILYKKRGYESGNEQELEAQVRKALSL